MNSARNKLFSIPVIVASLGYFVDIYDLVLFGIVRVQSLKSLGLQGQELLGHGVYLLNMQMAGMLLGGIFWGILGDKKGRLKILFGSIIMYSVANIANGFVTDINQYAALRFLAGVGLAGELGAGITLVSEILSKEHRGYGTMIVATIGVSGAVLANFVAENFDWRTAYFIGGGLGMALLVLRVSVYESGMYRDLEAQDVVKGSFVSLFTSLSRFYRYSNSILIGVPTWFVVGVLITFSPEFAKALHVAGEISAGKAIMFCYLGLVLGDFSSGLLSQHFASRRRIIFLFLIFNIIFITLYFSLSGVSVAFFYWICVALGFANGYWALFVTVAAEQFGTNLRATAATTVPNFVRGTVVPITLAFKALKELMGILPAAAVVGTVCLVIAIFSLYHLEETFGKDLNFLEE